MGRLKLAVAIISVGMLAGCGGGGGNQGGMTDPPAPVPTDSISGTITFKGKPLAGATVNAYDTNDNAVYQVTTTDANGNYSFSGIKTTGNVPMELIVWATKAGYGFYPSVGGGAKVTRAGVNGMFYGLNTLNPPIIFTVIDYVALPNASLAGANFNAYDGSNPPASIGRTGQTMAYASGDDGSLRKGAAWPATRFTDNQDGTVTDRLTGLVWLKDAGCFTPTVWSVALTDVNQLAGGDCGLTDGSTAGQWRLPNLGELESIVDVSASNPAIPAASPFINVSNGIYWSSTSYYGGQTGSSYAWAIRFSDGRYMNDSAYHIKATASNAVWAVKGTGAGAAKLQATGMYVPYESGDDGTLQMGVSLTSPRWIDKGNGTVTDVVTGLIWLKQANCINQPWAGAVAAVNKLASGQCGLTDGSKAGSWRMPNRNEMQSMTDRMQANHSQYFNYVILNLDDTVYRPAILTNFAEGQYYWTSTTDRADPSEVWTIFSCDFGVYDTPKSSSGYTLAVR